MQNISSLGPSYFIESDDESFSEVYKMDPNTYEITPTGVVMAVKQERLNGVPWRVEAVDMKTGFKALAKIKAMFPNWVSVLAGANVVVGKTIGLPALGTANTNLFVVVGGALALAPAWVLLANNATEASIRDHAEKIGVLGVIEDYRGSGATPVLNR